MERVSLAVQTWSPLAAICSLQEDRTLFGLINALVKVGGPSIPRSTRESSTSCHRAPCRLAPARSNLTANGQRNRSSDRQPIPLTPGWTRPPPSNRTTRAGFAWLEDVVVAESTANMSGTSEGHSGFWPQHPHLILRSRSLPTNAAQRVTR
jgi:hypothetical protein